MADTRQSNIQSFAFVISVFICVLFSMVFVDISVLLFGSASDGSEFVLDEKINPNDAPVASLIRLPNVGYLRAKAIVTYRESFRAKDDKSQPFQDCNDLQNIKGIGPKTAYNISPWLKFE
jgi:DNA uptake protein ComE-like DNA-binding protein